MANLKAKRQTNIHTQETKNLRENNDDNKKNTLKGNVHRKCTGTHKATMKCALVVQKTRWSRARSSAQRNKQNQKTHYWAVVMRETVNWNGNVFAVSGRERKGEQKTVFRLRRNCCCFCLLFVVLKSLTATRAKANRCFSKAHMSSSLFALLFPSRQHKRANTYAYKQRSVSMTGAVEWWQCLRVLHRTKSNGLCILYYH